MLKIMRFAIITIGLSVSCFASSYTMTPNGSYVGGSSYTMAPDGSYVSGSSYTMTPNGQYVGNGR
jgi:hypothetical protein